MPIPSPGLNPVTTPLVAASVKFSIVGSNVNLMPVSVGGSGETGLSGDSEQEKNMLASIPKVIAFSFQVSF